MDFDEVLGLLLKLWPLLLMQVGLMLWALIDLLRRWSTRTLSPPAWLAIVVIINFLGPIAYFLFGRSEH